MWKTVPQRDDALRPAFRKRSLCECALIRPPSFHLFPPPLPTHTPPSKDQTLKKRRKGWDQETPTGEFKSVDNKHVKLGSNQKLPDFTP